MKIKQLLLPVVIVVLSVSCGTKETQYALIEYKPGDEIKKISVDYEHKRDGKYYLISYKTGNGYKTFILTKDTVNQNNAVTALGFKFVNQKLIANKTQTDTVFTLAKNNATDGKTRFYWSPRHGVFLIQTINSPKSQILRSANATENSEIEHMIREVCPDTTFYFRNNLNRLMRE